MSKFTVKSDVLQTMLSKAYKGASRSKFNVMTNLVSVELIDSKLSLTTTDSNNYFTVTETVSGENTSFVVNVDTFSKLISKISTESITIDVSDDTITINGNGTYKLPIQLDVDGSPIKYPKKTINTADCSGTIKTAIIKNVILYNKPSLATSFEMPCLTGYLFTENNVISADVFNICVYHVNTFGKKILLAPIVLDLLSMSTDEEISYKISDDFIMFETSNMKLFATLMNGVDDYPVESIMNRVDTEYPSKCVLPKTTVLNIIDRISLFINDNDQNGVYLTFTKDGLKIESSRADCIESVPYQGSENWKDYSCFASVDSIKRQFNARVGESINLYYGDEDTFMIADDNVKQLSALLDDDRG